MSKTKAQLLLENKSLLAQKEAWEKQREQLIEENKRQSIKIGLLSCVDKPIPAISKLIFVEKLKDQKFTMKVNRGEIKEPKCKIAGELCDIADVVEEMTDATKGLLENHIAGTAVKIEVQVTVLG